MERVMEQIKDERVRRVEILISNLLRIGVITSLTIVILGTAFSFVHHPDYVWSSTSLHPLMTPETVPHTLPQVIDGVRHGRGQAVVLVGLLLLIATPVVRVAVSILAFVYQQDRTFTLITMLVLALLLLSFVLGKAEG
jgi:uncharacterized membrane protein